MNLLIHTGGFVQTNGFILTHEDGSCVVIDAPAGICDFLRGKSLTPTHLLLTHQHFDHVEDVAALRADGARVYAFQDYAPDIIMEKRVQEMGLPVKIPPYEVDEILGEQSSLDVKNYHFNLAHVPGHSPDSISFHLVADSSLFAGDSLFNGSIGRTDLPGGNHDQLLDSIRQKLYTLPEETAVFPGHGPQTSIGTEKKSNLFCPNT
ncbi:MAG: glyoxylase-like metal-dependent hydrolase (beta-lactamase superfamily II) [Akkermansiaceae bacterium]|jgi:hydroxyacylglutathione hydrolase|tara:strand:- start:178 stop:795 length:618 start_codon:yes stop_codon:yes gene_type:complete